jgi:hypothetical protein
VDHCTLLPGRSNKREARLVRHPRTLRRAYLPSTEPAPVAPVVLALKLQIAKRLHIKIGVCSTPRLQRQVASTVLSPATFLKLCASTDFGNALNRRVIYSLLPRAMAASLPWVLWVTWASPATTSLSTTRDTCLISMFIVTDFDTLLQAMSLEFGIYHEIVFERFDWRKSLAFTAFQRRGLKEGCSGSCISGRPVTASRDLEALHQLYRQGQTPVGPRREGAWWGPSESKSAVAQRHLSHWSCCKLGGDTGCRGDGACRGPVGTTRAVQESGKEKGESGCRRKSSRGRARLYT